MIKHDEELLEQLYWEFDSQRNKSGDERLAFKGKLRFYAQSIAKRKPVLPDLSSKVGNNCEYCLTGHLRLDSTGYASFLRCNTCRMVPF